MAGIAREGSLPAWAETQSGSVAQQPMTKRQRQAGLRVVEAKLREMIEAFGGLPFEEGVAKTRAWLVELVKIGNALKGAHFRHFRETEKGIAEKAPPVLKEKREKAIDWLKRGKNFAWIGRTVGLSDVTVGKIAREEKFKAGPQGAGSKIPRYKRSQVIVLLRGGDFRSFREVAKQIGDISHVTVAKIAKEENLSSKIAPPDRESLKHRHDARWPKPLGRSLSHK
jgi:hypothetical protein